MNALVLIQRELLVNARKPATRRLRIGIALATLLVAALFLLAMEGRGFARAISPGQALFQILIWMGFATAGLFGVFFAADTISEERREGTLGLLFLTPLRGRDVVFGKLTGTWLRTAYGLLAALPVIALTLLLGGVTFMDYFWVALVLANTLFLSTAIGLMVSSFSREPVRAIMGTLAVVLIIAGLPLWIDAALVDNASGFTPRASYLSPAFAMYVGSRSGSTDLWYSLLLQNALAWMALAIASLRTTRFGETALVVPKSRTARWLGAPPSKSKQAKLRNREPITWLVQRRSRGPTILALIALIASILCGIILFFIDWGNQHTFISQTPTTSTTFTLLAPTTSIFYPLLYFVILVWLAVLSTRRTGKARQEGELELLLATPVSVREIVDGHWRGLVRIFGFAILVLAALATVGIVQLQLVYIASKQSNSTAILTQSVISSAFRLIGIFTTTAAVAWVGLWLGLTGENQAVSAAKTFVLVLVVPALALIVLRIFGLFTGVFLTNGNINYLWVAAFIHGTLALAIDIAFIKWAHHKLLRHFRQAAAGPVKRKPVAFRERFTKPVITPEF